MSTICTCQNAGIKTGVACNYSEGCPRVTEKGSLKSPGLKYLCVCGHPGPCEEVFCYHGKRIESPFAAVAKEAEKIALGWKEPAETIVSKVLEAGNFLSGTGVVIKTPNGDEFRFRYDKDAGAIIVNKISDSMRTGAINIQPGGGANQIFIK